MKALVIEDHIDQQELCQTILELNGFEVTVVGTVGQACRMLDQEPWSLITLDVKLKGHSGLEVLQRLKESPQTIDIPVMVISAFTDLKIQQEALEMGAADFLVKPYNIELMGIRARVFAKRYQSQIVNTLDLRAAAMLQKNFLTPREKISGAFDDIGVNVVIYNKASDRISGDFYCNKEIKGRDSAGFFFADSCGHGLSAGLLSMRVLSLIESTPSPIRHPSEMLDFLNTDLCDVIPSNLFVAASYTIFTYNSLIFSNSGQPCPIVIHGDKVDEVSVVGPALGLVAGTVFADREVPFLEGDRMLIYTDGALEIENEAGEQFGEFRFKELCRKYKKEEPKQFVDLIVKELTQFHGSMNFEDDLTLSLFTRQGV